MSQTDPRAVAKAEEIVSHLEGTEGFTECVNIIMHALADAERRGMERAAKVAETLGVHPALNVWDGGPEWYKRGKEIAAEIRAQAEKEERG